MNQKKKKKKNSWFRSPKKKNEQKKTPSKKENLIERKTLLVFLSLFDRLRSRVQVKPIPDPNKKNRISIIARPILFYMNPTYSLFS